MTLDKFNEIKKNYKVLEIAVDFINPSYNISRAKRLDNSRYIVCTLTENGVPRGIKTNEVARIRLQKPDKTYVYNDCELLEDGRVLITLTEQILAAEGNAVCDIQLTNEDTGIIYSTKNFIINIDRTAVDNGVIESSDEFDALNNLIATNKKLNDEIKADENLRQSNEVARQQNETDRENAETERSEAEAVRTSNENERIISENVRKQNEANRQSNIASAVTNAETAAQKANAAADALQDKLNAHHFVLTEDKGAAGGVAKLDENSKIPITELYAATVSDKGITQLTDSITSTSTTTAATANSVKTAYEESKSYTDSKITDLVNGGNLGSIDISEQLANKVDKDGGITAANSLQVAALAGGASIAEGTDLDTLTVPGTYAAANAAVAATLLHCPISASGFVMYTFLTYPYNGGTSYRTQIIICGADTPSSFWIRNFNGSKKWCDWVRMKYTDPTNIAGNAATATKLATARIINGMYFDGNADRTNYAVCGTAGATAEKTVTCAGFTPSLGAEIVVYFQNANTADNPTLNVSGTGAKPIYYHGKAIPAGYIKAARIIALRSTGSAYSVVGDIDTDTTYSNMVGATASAAGKAGLVPAPAVSAVKYALYSNGAWLRPYVLLHGEVRGNSKAFTPPYTSTPFDILFILSSYLTFASTGSFYGAVSFYLPNVSTSMDAVSDTMIAGSSTGNWKYSVTASGVITITAPHTPWQYSVLCMPR
ncbi:MAG: BppU family phage baseplate upper protein [Butyrivibrio sp.]|nr:BppU family phage baseplate upper protein [Butyrivibrio sp.]